MAEVSRRWRRLWMGEGVCAALSLSSFALFFAVHRFGDFVLRHGWLVAAWIALLISPLLWLEFGISWVLAKTNEHWIRIGGALVFPGLVAVVLVTLIANPTSLDQLIQPVAFIWIVVVGMRLAHLWAVNQAARQD